MTYSNQWEQDMPRLSTVPSSVCLDQFTLHSTSTWWICFCFFVNGQYLLHWQLLDSVKGILWGKCLGWKSASLTPASSNWQFVLVCIASLCVLRVYVCVYMSVNCIVYFSSMIWPLIVLRKRKHNGSLSISFHSSFFLMSLPSRLTHFKFSFHRK